VHSRRNPASDVSKAWISQSKTATPACTDWMRNCIRCLITIVLQWLVPMYMYIYHCMSETLFCCDYI
jgi:hypothetical protein